MVSGYSGNAGDQISYHSSLPMPKIMTVAVLIVQLHSKGVADTKAAIVLILKGEYLTGGVNDTKGFS